MGFSTCRSGLWSTGSVVGVQGLSCPAAYGILPDQGSNPFLLHWQVDFLPLSYQESLKKGRLLRAFLLLLFSRSVVSDSATPWTAARQASLSFAISRGLLRFMSIESVMPSNYLILCRPLLLLPSIFPSTRVFSNDSTLCIMWPQYYNFNFSINPSNNYSGLTGFDLLTVQGIQESSLTPQFKSIESSFLWSNSHIHI